jgi:hypothetical protein
MSDSRRETEEEGATVESAGLRLLTVGGAEVNYSSELDLTERIWESSIYTEDQPAGAVLVLLSIEDPKDQNRIQVSAPRGHGDLFTIDRAIAMLTEVRRALTLSRLSQAG